MAGRKPHPNKIKEQAINLYKSGIGSCTISKQLRIPTGTICGWIKNAGIVRETNQKSNKRIKAYPKSVQIKAIELYLSGLSMKKVGDKIGVHPMTLWKWIKRKGLSRSKGSPKEKNVNWKGGITPEYNRIRNTPEYRRWRTSVYERDKWTCKSCEKVGGELRAHHILPFSKYPSMRLEINNGITLCEECHDRLHRRKIKVS